MDRKEVLTRVQDIVRGELNQPDLMLLEQTTAQDVSGWDSLTHVQIVVAIEGAFKFRLTASEVAQLENVGSLIDLVMRRGAKQLS